MLENYLWKLISLKMQVNALYLVKTIKKHYIVFKNAKYIRNRIKLLENKKI
jgi:hypothetical protein